MKQIFLLLILIICLLACDLNRSTGNGEHDFSMRGIYFGSFSATYPGADDGAVIVEDSIQLLLSDYRFSYYRFGGDQIDTLVDGSGEYTIENTIIFTNELTPETNPPLRINGAFNIRFAHSETGPDTMILTQGGTPDLDSFFETIYLITLVKSDAIRE